MGRFLGLARSKKVTVPEGQKVVKGNFYLLDGFLGMSNDNVDATLKAGEVVLQAEPGTYETTQVDATADIKRGEKVYWDGVSEKLTNVAANNVHVGTCVRDKDAAGCIWFDLAVQGADEVLIMQAAHVADVEGTNPTKAEFNALLKALRDAKILAAPPVEP